MIKGIRLSNWKTHLDSSFSFGVGTNVIVGVMGSGKTSIMDAICFALYGTFPALNARKVSLDETLMSKPSPADRAVVRLEFDYNGKDYVVERTVKRKGASEAVLYENKKLVAGPKPRDVNSKIEEIVGVSYELFSLAVYSEQNEIDRFLKLTPRERKIKFDELLSLDKYEEARANSVSLSTTVKRLIKEKEAALSEAKKDFSDKQLSDAKERVVSLEKEAEIKKSESLRHEVFVRENIPELQRLEGQLISFRELKNSFAGIVERESLLAKRISDSEREISALAGMEGADEVEGKILEAKKAILSAAEKEKTLSSQIAEASNSIGAQNAVARQLEKSLSGLKDVGTKCPICKNPLDSHRKGELEAEYGCEIEKCRASAVGFESVKKKLEKELEDARLFSRQRNNEAVLLEKRLAQSQGLEEKKLRLSSDKALFEKTVSEKKALEEKISGIFVDEKAISILRERLAEAREKVKSIEREISSKSELAGEIKKSIDAMERRKKLAEEHALFIDNASQRLGKLTIFSNALVAMQGELRDSLIEAINEAMGDVWERIYPYRDYTGAKISINGSDYEVVARTRGGEWVRVEGIMSGGERSSVALTLRIAVSLVLTRNLGWLILDEPTHNLDSNAVLSLSTMLREHLPALVEQIFIITHDKQMENASSASLYTLSRDKGRDEPTRIA